MSDNVQIEGLEEAQLMLRTAPRVMAQKALGRGMLAASKVVAEEVRRRLPVSTKATHTDPHLADSITVDIQIDQQAGAAHAEIGYGKQGYRGLWLEYGHQQITGGQEGSGGRVVGFVPPHPVMRPAVIASADAAIEAFGEAFVSTVEEEFGT
jgi:hypothetical protein